MPWTSTVVHLVGGLDLTGDPEYAYSQIYASAVLLRTFLLMPDVFNEARRIDFNSDWNSLFFFMTFLGMSGVAWLLACISGIGNASHPKASARCRAFFSIVSHVCVFALLMMSVNNKSSEEQQLDIPIYKWFVFTSQLSLLLVCIVIMCIRLFGKEMHNDIVLKADPQGRWGADDILGFEKAANVDHSYFSFANDELLVGPNVIAEIKGFFCPQPFSDRNRFPNTEKFKEVAAEAQIKYPIRLSTAMLATVFIVLGELFTTLSVTVPVIGKGEELARKWIPVEQVQADLETIYEALASGPPSSELNVTYNGSGISNEIIGMMSWAAENQNEVNDCILTMRNGGAWCDLATKLVAAVQNEIKKELKVQLPRFINQGSEYLKLNWHLEAQKTMLNEMLQSIKWWAGLFDRLILSIVVSAVLCALVTLWFVYAGKLAYRKKLLELALSSPGYMFDPKIHNGTRDIKFVASFSISLGLGFLFLFAVALIIAFACSIPEFWYLVLVHSSELLAFCIYEVMVILVFPQLHGKAILNKGKHLAHPRLQSALVFIWELFYAPQVAVSVLAKVALCLVVSLLMFLRPDVPVLPQGFAWLDSLHISYVSSVYAHLAAGLRRSEYSNLINQFPVGSQRSAHAKLDHVDLHTLPLGQSGPGWTSSHCIGNQESTWEVPFAPHALVPPLALELPLPLTASRTAEDPKLGLRGS